MNKEYLKDLLKTLENDFEVYRSRKPIDMKNHRKLGGKDPDVTLAIYNNGEEHWKLNRVYERIKIKGVLPDNKAPFEMSINLDEDNPLICFCMLYVMKGDDYHAISQQSFATKEDLLKLVEKHITLPRGFD